MQAIQLTKYGEPEESLRLAEIAEPDRPQPGQILIGVEYAPINDNDMLLARGLYTIQPKLPSVVGNEGAGKVLAVGDGVQNVKPGDRVVVPPGVFSWAEKVLAPAEKAIVLPAEIDPPQAAMLSINPPAAALLLEEFVSLKPDDWIVQNAANSGVGRSVIAFGKQKGVRTINIVRRPELIQELKDIGADVVLLAGPNAASEPTPSSARRTRAPPVARFASVAARSPAKRTTSAPISLSSWISSGRRTILMVRTPFCFAKAITDLPTPEFEAF